MGAFFRFSAGPLAARKTTSPLGPANARRAGDARARGQPHGHGRPADRGPVGRGAAGERRPRWSRTTSGGCAACSPPTAGAEIVTRGRAYELRIDRELVDVCRLERLVSEAARAAAAGGRETRRARRWRCSAAIRSRTWPTSRSPPGDPAARGAAADAPRSWRSTPTSPPAATRSSSARSRRCWPRTRCASGCTRSGCSPCTGAAARPRRSRPTATPAHAGRGDRRRAGAGAAAPARGDPAPGPVAGRRAGGAELPRELDATASPPLIGRDGELRRLRARWRRGGRRGRAGDARRRVRDGQDAAGRGDRRRGPSRSAAVLYAAGTGAPEAALAAIARARRGGRRCSWSTTPTARPPRCAPRCASSRRALGALPVLVLATGQEAAALARLEPHESVALEPLDADGVRAIAGLLRPGRRGDAVPVETLLATSRGSRAASTRRRASGRGARRRAASTRSPVARRPAAARPARSRPSWPAASSSCSRRASAPASSRADGDDRARRWSARTRASRRSTPTTPSTSSGASGSSPSWSRARRRAAARGRRPVGQRQVVGGAGRPAARARGRRAARAARLDAGADPARRAPAARARPRDPPARARAARRCSRSTSSRSCSPPAGRGRARPSSSPRSCAPARPRRVVVVLAVRADFYGRCAAYPELVARCSAPTTCSSGRCRATSCGARSSARRSGSA